MQLDPHTLMQAVAGQWCTACAVPVQRVVIDSRQVRPGDLFVALAGPHHDGHDYLAKVARQGAVAALVQQQPDSNLDLPCLQVRDTRIGLQQLAGYWRAQWSGPLVGLTGSNGKSSGKQALQAILPLLGEGMATAGNLNNHYGVPLTLLRLRTEQRWAVVEMGASQPGDIAELVAMARPSVAWITGAAAAHLHGFASLDGVVQGKGELLDDLPEDGLAVLYGDEPSVDAWMQRVSPGVRVIRYGVTAGMDLRADVVQPCFDAVQGPGIQARLHWQGETHTLKLALPGVHNILNAMGALAVGTGLGLAMPDMLAALDHWQPMPGRLQWRPVRPGLALLDDSYNANPASVRAGVAVLRQCPGQWVLVLGDLAELGDAADAAQAALLDELAAAPLDIWLCGTSWQAHRRSGMHWSADVAGLHQDLASFLSNIQATVLVKGSRSAGMEAVVEHIQEALC